jgi:uncharacterized membrane protein YphA (DoxX/SURF4 family)
MNKVIRLGKYFFAVSMMAFGILQFVSSAFVPGLLPVPAWVPARMALAYLTGIVLITAGVSIVVNRWAHLSATFLAFMWFLFVLIVHLPRLAGDPHNGSAWASAFEALSMSGAALVLAGSLSVGNPHLPGWESVAGRAISVGRIVFAISFPVFGIQHFIYAGFVSTMVPSWIPARLFWAYFTGVAHIAAGLSILAKVKARLAAMLLALMVGLWVLILHIPRIVASPHSRTEWTGAFIALAICGGALLIAGSLRKEARLIEGIESSFATRRDK